MGDDYELNAGLDKGWSEMAEHAYGAAEAVTFTWDESRPRVEWQEAAGSWYLTVCGTPIAKCYPCAVNSGSWRVKVYGEGDIAVCTGFDCARGFAEGAASQRGLL